MLRRRPNSRTCSKCSRPAEAGSLCAEHAAQHQAAEARRQERAAESGSCASCGGPIQPWRDSHLCALCARADRPTSQRRCSRCGERGHRVETCEQAPPGWLSAGEEGTELVPVELTHIEQYGRAKALAETQRELEVLRAAHRQERRRMADRERELEQRQAELAGAVVDESEMRPVRVRGDLDLAAGIVRVVRCDTGEVLRERALSRAELSAVGRGGEE